MFSAARGGLRPANIQTTSIRAWPGGQQSENDIARMPQSGLYTTLNAILAQNSVIRPRPGMMLYGAQPQGTVLGEIFQYKDTTVTPSVYYRLCLMNVGGTTQVYYSKDTGPWTAAPGKTYNATARGHFFQLNNQVGVMNGEDNFSLFAIATRTITPFLALTTPSAPTLTTNTGLTGTTFTITYRIAANSKVGTSIGSTALSVPVSTDRDQWNPTTQSLKISWTAVAGAESYNVYMGVGGVGTEFLIASGISGTTYTDNGSAYQDTTQPYPLVDSTAGPPATRGEVINGQAFLTGIKNDPFSVKVGGTYPYSFDFSPAHGGNTVPIGVGSKYLPQRVRLFRNFNGSSGIKVYCGGPNGTGKRYTMTPDTLTVASQTVAIFNVTEDNGEDGTNSPDALIYYQDSNYYPSLDGFKTDGTVPQLQNIISTRRVSNTISPDMSTLNPDAMDKAVGLATEGRGYFALPVNSNKNTQIWVYDFDRSGAWMKPITVAADWMMLYNSNPISQGGDGAIHFIVLSNNKIYEFSYHSLTNDDGVPYPTGFASGQIFFSQDQRVCAKVLYVIFTILRPSGTITVNVSGQFRDTPVFAQKTVHIDPGAVIAGWSEAAWGEQAWSDINASVDTSNLSSVDIKVKVGKEMRWLEYALSTTDANVDYQMHNVVAEYVVTGIRDV